MSIEQHSAGILPVASAGVTMRALLRAIAAYPRSAVSAGIVTLVASAAIVTGPLLLGRLVDAVSGGASTTELVALIAVLATTMLFTGVFTAAAQRAVEHLGAQIAADLREQALEHALRMDPTVLELAGAGDVASRVTDDIERYVEAVPLAASVFTALVTVGVAAAGFATLDWRLALAFSIVFPVYVLSLRIYLPRSGPLYAHERRAAAQRSRILLQSLHSLPTVRAYRMHELQTARVETASHDAVESEIRATRLSAIFATSMNGAEAIGLSALLVAGYALNRADAVSIGDITAAGLLFHRLFGPLGTLLMSFDDIQRAGAALARVVGIQLVATAPVRAFRAPAGPVAINCVGLSHSYDGGRTFAVHDVTLSIPAGTSLAIVGASGAGKTTLANLIGGTFPAASGRIVFTDDDGDTATDDIGFEQLRDWIAIISQETHVFTGTLRDDITYAAPRHDDADIIKALHTVGAADWVLALPAGLDTLVGQRGHPLSSAQVQQLALARTLMRDPPAIVLDEATAEAGSSGARELEHAAIALTAGRTAVIVAHRLTQARACDRIIVMDRGRVVESGDHEALLAQQGHYASLWRMWASGQATA